MYLIRHAHFIPQTHALVNSVGAKMDMNAGVVSHAISRKAGPQLQQACNKLAPINMGEVKETPGYNMECRTILHCLCPQRYTGPETIKVGCLN